MGRGRDHLGCLQHSRGGRPRAAATSTARTSSSSAAAPRTCPRGLPAAARGRSASTSRRRSSRRRARCSGSSGSSSRSSRPTRPQTGLPDGSADLVVSEYGASIWVDPYRWIPEAARLLRPGGELVFLRNSTLVILCSPDDDVPAGEQLRAAPVRPAPRRLVGRASSSTSPTATGSVSSAPTASRSSTSSSSRRRSRPRRTRTTTTSPPTGRRKWPAEEIWVARKR